VQANLGCVHGAELSCKFTRVALSIRGIGYMDVVEALLPSKNATKIFLPILTKILVVLMCYINYLSGYISYFDTGYWFLFSNLQESLQ
jgi:hypothetical protein